MLAHVIDTWRGAGFAEIVVVLGSGAAELRAAFEENLLRVEESEGSAEARDSEPGEFRPGSAARTPGAGAPPPVRFVENADWASGMFSSVRRGLAAALEGPSTHVAVSPADLPFLRESSLRTLLDALSLPEAEGPATLVVPVCGRRRGHPLVLPRTLAERVLSWPPGARLNRLFAEPDVSVFSVEGFDETILADVDRPADLAARVAAEVP